MNNVIWTMLTLQAVMGFIDIVVHHEFLERLALRSSARRELQLHGIRNLLYTLFYLLIAWFEPHGVWAALFIAVLLTELLLTFWDWIAEDASRSLAPSERVLHGLLTINYGVLITLLAPLLWSWSQEPTMLGAIDHGLWSWLATLFGLVAGLLGVKDLIAAGRVGAWDARKGSGVELVAELSEPQALLVTGATGLIGRRLVPALLAAGHQVTVLSRRPQRAAQLGLPITIIGSLASLADDCEIDGIVHLAGEPVAAWPWTAARKRALLVNRTNLVEQVATLAHRLRRKPRVWINASAVGWYGLGHAAEQALTERSSAGQGFTHELCAAMENQAINARNGVIRLVNLRIGLVLSRDAGYLAQLLIPIDLFCGAVFGRGTQWQSWVHRDDVVRAIAFCLARPQLAGAVNLTAPEPVRLRVLVQQVAAHLGRRVWIRVPAAWLQLLPGGMAEELLLASQKVLPDKLLHAGFEFRYPQLDGALVQELS
ncbi:MAG: TIGR01777 family oxidoreductase [Pseudomonadales bacterium]